MAEPQVSAPAAAPVVATPAAPTAALAAVVDKGEYGGPKGESFAQALNRLGGLDPTSAQQAAPEPAPPAEPTKQKGKGKKEPKAPAVAAAPATEAESPVVDKKTMLLNLADELGLDDSRPVLKALAQKLGMDVDDARVTAKERIEFREAKRKHHERMQAEEQDLVRRWNEAKASVEPRLARTQRIDHALESGDFEGLAKELGAESWNGLQEKVLAALSDPNYKRLQELERQVQARERQENETRQEMQRREESRAKAAAMQTHRQNLSAAMAQSKDPLVAAMHDDPLFINSVIEVQRQNWDGSTTVTPEQAIKIAAEGFQAPLAQTMKQLYDKLTRVFGATPAQAQQVLAQPEVQAAAEAAAELSEQPAGKTGKKNKTSAPAAPTGNGASPPRAFANKKEADAHFTRELQKAIAADRD